MSYKQSCEKYNDSGYSSERNLAPSRAASSEQHLGLQPRVVLRASYGVGSMASASDKGPCGGDSAYNTVLSAYPGVNGGR